MTEAARLSVTGLSKAYAAPVLTSVDFEVRAGEVHALMGENGAGKSTLCRIIAGLAASDAGSMRLDGAAYQPASKAAAEARGVSMVMQELSLLGTLSIAENLFLRRLPRRLGFVDTARLHEAARRVMDEVFLGAISPETQVSALGIGQRQLVEIARGLAEATRVLILDEPTAALTTAESALLFAQIEKLTARGVGVVYISHRLEEITRVAHRVTVLRDGRAVWTRPVAEATEAATVQAMVGRELSQLPRRADTKGRAEALGKARPALRVLGLGRGARVRDVSFTLREGEVLGFAGLMGSGRTETMRALFGADAPDRGQIYLGESNKPARLRGPQDAVRLGLALLTEDRKAEGLLLPLSVRENVTLGRLRDLCRAGVMVDRMREDQAAEGLTRDLAVRCASIEQPARELSGGNQQKVVLARWLYRDPSVLILDEPTRGIDVGAKREIYARIEELAARGKALLVVSSDLRELDQLADRIAVMSAGRIAAVFEHGAWSDEAILRAALSGYAGPREAEAAPAGGAV
jgi:ribose transport system ATP-binding protein